MLSDRETLGGAAVAATRLGEQLADDGHSVSRIVRFPEGGHHSWMTRRLELSRLSRLVSRLLPARLQARFRQSAAARRLGLILREIQPDVVNLHNIHGSGDDGWSVEVAAVCAEYAPVVWTLHDMWSFTGRCAYAWDCEQYRDGCDYRCPTPDEYPALHPRLIRSAWRQRRRVLSSTEGLVAVAPSRWLQGAAKRGMWRDHRVDLIPNGLPLTVYHPVDRDFARRALQIETQRPVLLACAEDWSERRKGGEILRRALGGLPRGLVHLVTLGRTGLSIPGQSTHNLGYVDHERTRVLAYSAADLLVHPAPVDNLPNVVLEAMACGTPVIGLPVGGVPEMVRPGLTGWLAVEPSAEALAAAIGEALEALRAGTDLRETCRRTATTEYDQCLQSSRYSALFEELVADRATGS